MKVLILNGSPHAEGNTYHALRLVLVELENQGIETEIIHIGNKRLHSCMGCGACYKRKDGTCVLGDEDGMNEWVEKVKEADGILLGSPVHFSGISGAMKCFCDRLAYAGGACDKVLYHKVGAAVVAVRRSGGVPAMDALMKYLTYHEMLIPGSNYWNVIHGRVPGEVHQDDEGVQIMQVLGRNMAWMLKMREEGLAEAPERVRKTMTHFVR
jgi:multimeric flavodoxin WrbA